MAGQGGALGLGFEHLRGKILYGLFRRLLVFAPSFASQLMELRVAVSHADVAAQQVCLAYRDVQFAAVGVLHGEYFLAPAVDVYAVHAEVFADPVIDMHHQFARLNVGPVGKALAFGGPLSGLAVYVVLAAHRLAGSVKICSAKDPGPQAV